MSTEKFVLYKSFGKYCVTPESNYDNLYTDDSKITKLTCDSAKDAIDTLVMYGVLSEEEIINKTGETI
jgi:hypothetical protein